MITERINVEVQTTTTPSYRAEAVAGIFDLDPAKYARQTFTPELPRRDQAWRIGLIVGPSGSGKSTIARHAFGAELFTSADVPWPTDRTLLDGFPQTLGTQSLGVKEITAALTAVGFSSPPAWLRPFHTLSNGEQFRATLAAALLSGRELVAFDEFTSVVDRDVAKIGSAALAKQIRADRSLVKQFVAIGCHYDIIDWLCPDWILDTATFELARRRLRRPSITLALHRCAPRAWRTFARHHYLSSDLHRAARCYLALWEGRPVAFVATLPMYGFAGSRRISRFVVLPDFQGVGIGSAVLAAAADEELRAGARRVRITTSHPAVISHCKRSAWWKCCAFKSTGFGSRGRRTQSTGRAVASFQFKSEEYHHAP